MKVIVAMYRSFMRITRWYGRLVTSIVAGLMAAMLLCLGGGRLAGSGGITLLLLILAVPLWIVVSVISYKFLKPEPEGRD
jgi:hypothetical protein